MTTFIYLLNNQQYCTLTFQVICLIGDKIVVREVDNQRQKIGSLSKDSRRHESLEFKVDYVQVLFNLDTLKFE